MWWHNCLCQPCSDWPCRSSSSVFNQKLQHQHCGCAAITSLSSGLISGIFARFLVVLVTMKFQECVIHKSSSRILLLPLLLSFMVIEFIWILMPESEYLSYFIWFLALISSSLQPQVQVLVPSRSETHQARLSSLHLRLSLVHCAHSDPM